jgi:hypothetical protein
MVPTIRITGAEVVSSYTADELGCVPDVPDDPDAPDGAPSAIAHEVPVVVATRR